MDKSLRRKRLPTPYLKTKVSRMILCGTENEEIRKYIEHECPEFGDRYVTQIIRDAKTECRKHQYKSITALCNKNVGYLQNIVDSSMMEENYEVAMKAMDMLNKMGGVYTQSSRALQILTKDTAIQIKFDE